MWHGKAIFTCICIFPTIFHAFPPCSYGAEYQDIIDGLKACEQLEVDEENECVRLKENWELVYLHSKCVTSRVF